MKRTWCLAALLAVLALTAPASASDPTGIYAVVDKVIMEPTENAPERIQVWGVFCLATGSREYTPPERGYMYFAVVKGKEDVCRKEWSDLKKVAGTGDVVAFASRFDPKGRIHKKERQQPVAVEAAKITKLIADLDSDKPAVRDQATAKLEKLGPAAEASIRKALSSNPTPEVKRRLDSILAKANWIPDPHPLGVGMHRIPGDTGWDLGRRLLSMPAPMAPAEDQAVEPGKVTLTAKNILYKKNKDPKYVFEIEGSTGKETSEPLAAGDKETKWSPKMEVKSGQKYVWRVWVVDGEWKGPVALTEFKGK